MKRSRATSTRCCAEGPVDGYAAVERLRDRSGGQFDLPRGTVSARFPRGRGWLWTRLVRWVCLASWLDLRGHPWRLATVVSVAAGPAQAGRHPFCWELRCWGASWIRR